MRSSVFVALAFLFLAQRVSAQSEPNYQKAMAKAIAEDIPFVVWSSDTPPTHTSVKRAAVVSRYVRFDTYRRESIIINWPDGKGGFDVAWRYEGILSDAAIQREIDAGRKVQPSVSPFSLSPQFNQVFNSNVKTSRYRQGEAAATADVDKLGRGPWPKSVAFPDGLVRYRSTEYTQRIAVTNDRDTITPNHRSGLIAKWQVPGGMVGVEGWRSDLYKFIAPNTYTWVDNIPVWNGNNFQNNRGHVRKYGDGTFFMDVLSYKGSVFEHRVREKKNSQWESYVAYRDSSAYPPGYTGLHGAKCASCHQGGFDQQPGTGGYAVGLIPGGDSVYSDPFDALEVSARR
jgi:hypothetical protein